MKHQPRVLLALVLWGGLAWSKNNIEIKNEAFQEVKEKKDGKEITKTIPAVKVMPGDAVIFVITYKNVGKEPATEIVVTNPIPKHMVYQKAESSKGNNAEVSVDGGSTWGELSKLKVTDDKRKTRPALPEDVTHVRWKISKALMPKEEGKARLFAVLK